MVIDVKYAAILSFFPKLRVHDIVVFNDNGRILTIDYTPINQSHPHMLLKLLIGKNVPAEIRIRRMDAWNLIFLSGRCNDIDNNNLKQYIINVTKKWTHNDMNLYTRNCKHFSRFLHKFVK
jgi:hypothetical protein